MFKINMVIGFARTDFPDTKEINDNKLLKVPIIVAKTLATTNTM